MPNPPEEQTRFVGLDISKQTIVVAALDQKQQLVIKPTRIACQDFEKWARQQLRPTDQVVLEASGSSWYWYDLVQPLVSRVVVAHAQMIKLITAGRVKTDQRDAVHLARLLAADLLPEVWVPPKEIRELRSLVRQRNKLVGERTRARNRLHAILMAHNLVPEVNGPFSLKQREWWLALKLSPIEKLLVKQELARLDYLEPLIKEAENTLYEESQAERWAKQVVYLIQLPGIGILTAMVLLSAIGDISRFESAKKLVGYSGLGASIYASGQTVRTGGITKQGRRELRGVMIEAAWIAVENDPYWKQQFQRLTARLSKGKAIVAIVRKLLVVVWNCLSKQTADRQAVAEKVARKIFKWSQKLQSKGRGGMSGGAFVRQELERLRLGQEIEEVKTGRRHYRIPPVVEKVS
jgi:transposase